jgi:serine/threonine protein kinase
MELLQHDLNRSHEYSGPEMVELAHEALRVMEGVHAVNVLHQDLKPHNLMRGQEGCLYFIDFGLARQVPLRRGRSVVKGFIGTPRYASVRAHNMLEQSKKDDLESLFYNLAYLYYRRLPWSKLSVPADQRL